MRSFPLEVAKALNPRETGIQVEGGWGGGEYVNLGGVSVRVRALSGPSGPAGLARFVDEEAAFGVDELEQLFLVDQAGVEQG
ncbi:MAG: hypothetical protein WBN14_17685, partial [Polyangiales bacterium]